LHGTIRRQQSQAIASFGKDLVQYNVTNTVPYALTIFITAISKQEFTFSKRKKKCIVLFEIALETMKNSKG
jgi:hypothetical protein